MASFAFLRKLSRLVNVKEAIMGFSIWLAILSLFASINANVFGQEDEPLLGIISSPLSRIFRPTPQPISLTGLLQPKPPNQLIPVVQSEIKSDNEPALYIFALDVSRSMLLENVSKEEMEEYREYLKIEDPLVDKNTSRPYDPLLNKKDPKTFEIARAELMRYIQSLPENAHAALWTFGSSAAKICPEGDDLYMVMETTSGGIRPNEKYATKKVLELKASHEHTNFEKLLQSLYGAYRKYIKRATEIHFIIVSDFAHDVGGGRYLKDTPEASGETVDRSSRYRASATKIADLFRELSQKEELSQKGKKTFHLAVVSGARRVICAILPIIGETLATYSYRETQLVPNKMGKEFDFLRSYQESNAALPFYYTLGDFTTLPAEILIDNDKYEKSKIRFALASEAQVAHPFPLKIKTAISPKINSRSDILQLDSGGINMVMERPNDKITLQPLSTLDAKEAATYRLLISWDDQNGEGGTGTGKEANSRTYAVAIKFSPRLSFYSALSILIAEISLTFFAGVICYRAYKFFRGPRDDRPADGLPQIDAAQARP